LTNHPDVYLYGALYFASTFIRGMDQATVAQFKAQYEAALKQVEEADEKDKYNGTPLVQRSGININNFDNVK
jgi:ribosomal protein L6P/L9E